MGILCIFISILGLIYSYISEKKILYHGVIFNIIWGSSVLISMLGLYNIEIPNDKTYTNVLIGIIAFNFSIHFAKIFVKKSSEKNEDIIFRNISNFTTIKRQQFIGFQVVIIVMMIPYIKRALSLSVGTDFNLMRNAIYATENNEILTSGRDHLILFTIILSSVIASMIITTYLLYTKQSNLQIILLCLIQIIMYSWITGGRSLILRGIVFIVIGYLFLGSSQFILTRKMKRFIYISTIFLLSLLIIGTNMRSDYYNESILFWAVVYLSGPLIYMSKTMEVSMLAMNFSYGGISFGGLLYYPIYYINKFLGTSYESVTTKLSFLDTPINIRDGSTPLMYNALGSATLNFYYDLGIIGIILGFLLLGFLSTIMYVKFKKNKDLVTFSTLLLTYYCVIFSILRWEPVTIWIWGSFFVVLIANILFRKKVGDNIYEKNNIS